MSKSIDLSSMRAVETFSYVLDRAMEGARIVVPGEEMLLRAQFQRHGGDLLLIGTGEHAGLKALVPGYFSLSSPPDLVTAAGARITGDLAVRLAGPLLPGVYAEAVASEGQTGIGSVDSVSGEAVVVRAGVEIPITKGMPLLEGDVVQTGAKGSVGLIYADKSTVALGDHGRLVIETMQFDPAAGTGKSSTNVVQGVFSFTSGAVAKLGPNNMVFKTPVAEIGIRGTTVAGKAAAEGKENTITLLQDANGSVGEITVKNDAGTQILSKINQTTTVMSFTAPPAHPIVMSDAQISQRYGAARQAMPPPQVIPTKSETHKADEAAANKEGQTKESKEKEVKEVKGEEGKDKEVKGEESKDKEVKDKEVKVEEGKVEEGKDKEVKVEEGKDKEVKSAETKDKEAKEVKAPETKAEGDKAKVAGDAKAAGDVAQQAEKAVATEAKSGDSKGVAGPVAGIGVDSAPPAKASGDATPVAQPQQNVPPPPVFTPVSKPVVISAPVVVTPPPSPIPVQIVQPQKVVVEPVVQPLPPPPPPVILVNTKATGEVIIGGTAQQGQSLTVSNTLADANGLGTIQYQWQSSADGSTGWTNISTSTPNTLTLTQAEVGKYFHVVASYIDQKGFAESVTSSSTASVANVNDLPTGSVAVTGTAMQRATVSANNTLSDVDGLGAITYQWQSSVDGSTGWTNIADATSNTLTLTQNETGKYLHVVASYTDKQGTAESVASPSTGIVEVYVNHLPTGSVTVSGTVEQFKVLTATNSLADADGLGTIHYQWQASVDGSTGWTNIANATANTLTLTQNEVGKYVHVVASYTDPLGAAESVSSSSTGLVAAHVNHLPTGSVTVSGSAALSSVLTANHSLADADGLGTITYQWQVSANGTTGWSTIVGVTGNSYTLTQAEVGQYIHVVANYTDLLGASESVTSSSTGAVASHVNNAPTGAVTVTGAAVQNSILTASNTLADVDGLGTITYQWQSSVNGVTGWNTIIGANASTYAPTQAEVGKYLHVVANYTDLFGVVESMASSATGVVANLNDAPTGSVFVNGTAAQNNILTASHSLFDADGLGTINYVWQVSADGVTGWTPIANATSSSYTLTQNEVGKYLQVVASYSDLFGATESKTSLPTAKVELGVSNHAPTGAVTVSGLAVLSSPLSVTHTLADADGLGDITYQWQVSSDGISGWTNIVDATSHTFTVTQSEVGKYLHAVASYTDLLGKLESVSSTSTTLVLDKANLITGTTSNDQLTATSAAGWMIQGLGGNDTITGLQGVDILDGGEGHDILDGGAGADKLTGGPGKDIFVIGAGSGGATLADADLISDFNLANDLLGLSGSLQYSDLSFSQGSTIVRLASTGEYLAVLQNVNLADFTPMMLTGMSTTPQTLSGTPGNDILRGGMGSDDISGGAGNDIIQGGGGNDTIHVTGKSGTFVDKIDGFSGSDTLMIDYSGVTALDSFVSREFANDSHVWIDANGGRIEFKNIDTLQVGGSTYYFVNETPYSSMGSMYTSGYFYYSIDQNKAYMFDGGVDKSFNTFSATSFFSTHENVLTITGSVKSDLIKGTSGADDITTGAGDDFVEPKDGADSVRLGDGNDVLMLSFNDTSIDTLLDGGTGTDWLHFGYTSGDGGKFTLTSMGAVNFENLYGSSGNDTLTGDVNPNELRGGHGSDTIYGGGGNDILYGDKGTIGEGVYANLTNENYRSTVTNDDILDGGIGADTLTGGVGNDVFVISAGNGGSSVTDADVILDFSLAQDLLGLGGTLGYSDLTFSQGSGSNAKDLIVRQTSSGEYLAVIKDITASDFTPYVVTYMTTTPKSLTGTSGNDLLHGGMGNDDISGLGGSDIIQAGGGNDLIHVTAKSGAFVDKIDGFTGTDSLSIDYAGIVDIDSFTRTFVNDSHLWTDANGGRIEFKNIESVQVGGSTFQFINQVQSSSLQEISGKGYFYFSKLTAPLLDKE
ncbi:MAG: FecR domain-containing protein [Magnetococcales bacterium]|nr:FecR domain-containing protein [Magnetococcales bacterium]